MSDGVMKSRGRTALFPAAVAALLVMVVLSACSPGLGLLPVAALVAQQQTDPRLFPSGYRIANDAIYDYFQHRGGERTFGDPVSNVFTLRGIQVQIFQRQVLQIKPDGSVAPMNLLDELLPYTHFNGSTIPAPDDALVHNAPPATDGGAVLAFVQDNAPNTFDNRPVNFGQTFFNQVALEDAFPDGDGDPGLLPLMDLEILGMPTSKPTQEPRNHEFYYLRFQRGVLMYDGTSGKTEPMLLADYFKSLLTGVNLPPDLEGDAAASPFLRQYDPSQPGSVARPLDLPSTDLTGAFNPDDIDSGSTGSTTDSSQQDVTDLGTDTGTDVGTDTGTIDTGTSGPGILPGDGTPEVVANPSQCQGDEKLTVVPPDPRAGDTVLIAATSSKSHVYTQLFGTEKTTKVREDARPGQEGYVWEWTVQPTYNGPQVYTFYIDSTVPCASISFNVGDALATITPSATKEPTNTKTPKPTKTPTDTPTPTETPTPLPDLNRSDVTVSKRSIRGDNSDSATLTVSVVDSHGAGVPGILIKVTATNNSSVGDFDSYNIDPSSGFTDGSGVFQATITSCYTEAESTPPPTDTVKITVVIKGDNGQSSKINSPASINVNPATNSSC